MLPRLQRYLANRTPIDINADCYVTAPNLVPAGFAGPKLKEQDSILLRTISNNLREYGGMPKSPEEWKKFVNEDELRGILNKQVIQHYSETSINQCKLIIRTNANNPELTNRLREQSKAEIRLALENETVIAGVLHELFNNERTDELTRIFYTNPDFDAKKAKSMTSRAASWMRFKWRQTYCRERWRSG